MTWLSNDEVRARIAAMKAELEAAVRRSRADRETGEILSDQPEPTQGAMAQ